MSIKTDGRAEVPSFHLGFFAARDDQIALIEHLLNDLGLKVFELYSRPDCDLREFRSAAEVAEAFPLGHSSTGATAVTSLQLWSPDFAPEPRPERFELDPRRCGGHTFRHRLMAPGLIQLHLGGLYKAVLTLSTVEHLSETKARAGKLECDVDWPALGAMARKIRYQISRRMASASVPGCAVMQHALALVRTGVSLRVSTKTPWAYELKPTALCELAR